MPEKRRIIISYTILGALLCLFLLLNLFTGAVRMSPGEIMSLIFRPDGGTGATILWKIRLPRLLAAAILGGALAVSGLMLQTFFANPIAGPFVLGISSGAKLTVAVMLILALGQGFALPSVALIGAALVGSLICMGFILLVSGKVRRMGMLIICGVMIGYICSAITDFVVAFADDTNIVKLHNWSMGSFSGMSWQNLGWSAMIVFACVIGAFMLTKPMGAYQLGESYAASMGVNVRRFRVELILLSSLLSATVTAFAGPVSFVGVAVPHLVKSLFKTSRPIIILPACFLGGSVFCLACDLIARSVFSPNDLSISSVTAIIGAPVVIWLMVKRGRSDA